METKGKARRAAKHQRAAKQRARHKRARELQREQRHSKLAAFRAAKAIPSPVSPPPPPPTFPPQRHGPSEDALAAMRFFRHHDLDAYKVLAKLLEDSSNGCWIFFGFGEDGGHEASYVVTPDVRSELIAHLQSVLFQPQATPQQPEVVDEEPKDVL